MKNALDFRRLVSLTLQACFGLTVLGLLSSCGQKQGSQEADKPPAASSTNGPAAAARPDPAFAKLTGRWQRPDGGYILQISAVDSAGKMDTAYFNPAPIQVSRAYALKEGDTTKVFVELRDTGYPGCTYSLKYDPQVDQLFGEYFQAAMGETFNVTFTRLKEP